LFDWYFCCVGFNLTYSYMMFKSDKEAYIFENSLRNSDLATEKILDYIKTQEIEDLKHQTEIELLNHKNEKKQLIAKNEKQAIKSNNFFMFDKFIFVLAC